MQPVKPATSNHNPAQPGTARQRREQCLGAGPRLGDHPVALWHRPTQRKRRSSQVDKEAKNTHDDCKDGLTRLVCGARKIRGVEGQATSLTMIHGASYCYPPTQSHGAMIHGASYCYPPTLSHDSTSSTVQSQLLGVCCKE